MSECATTILTTPIFKQNLTVENGIIFTKHLNEIMKGSKSSINVTASMLNLNRVVLIFK